MNRIAFVLLFAAVAGPAFAHTGHAEAQGFLAGALHPFGGADHVLAMLAAGLWAGIAGARAALMWPAAFLGAMAAGFSIAVSGTGLPAAEAVIAVSVVALGAAAAFDARPPVAIGATVCGLFAFFHGAAHGTEMPANAAAIAYSAGFLLSTALLLGTGLVAVLTGRLARVAALGAAVAGLALPAA